MSQINGPKIQEILGRVRDCRHDPVPATVEQLLDDVQMLAQTIQSIRESVHTTEDAGDFCLWVAKLLGTNCESGTDIDQES